ncbi:MAG: hypothetical protein QOJ81_2182 [Chloroflexota bacterium]|jgi:hypothetical protein|nr:hypothetical protein [Chloroflexota bacterium]
MRTEIENALAAWRDAERRLQNATDGDRAALEAEVVRHRTAFHHLSADHMMERIDALHDAEERRHAETPSTDKYHEVAREEKAIAAEIFDAAVQNDEDTPGS